MYLGEFFMPGVRGPRRTGKVRAAAGALCLLVLFDAVWPAGRGSVAAKEKFLPIRRACAFLEKQL